MPWCTYVFDECALRFGCVVGLPAMLRCSRGRPSQTTSGMTWILGRWRPRPGRRRFELVIAMGTRRTCDLLPSMPYGRY